MLNHIHEVRHLKKGQKFIKDISGIKRGMITVVSFAYYLKRRAYWHCLCECGNKCILRRKDIFEGRNISCGCRAVISHGNLQARSLEEAKKYKINCIMNMSHWENDCLIWDGYHQNGLPKTSFLNIVYTTKRLLWILKYGSVPYNKDVYSGCLNKSCINIKHLRLRENGKQNRENQFIRKV